MRLLKLFYLFFLSFSVNAMDEFIIASAGQVVEPTPQIEEPKQPEVKPEDPPVVQATEVPTEETIPEKDMQAEIDNDLNQKDIEEVKAESSSTLKKITETEAKTEKNPVNETVEQITNDVPVDTKSANLESSIRKIQVKQHHLSKIPPIRIHLSQELLVPLLCQSCMMKL